MSIVRSLLIKIGFVTDKSAVNQANKAIAGFKTRFALAASAAGYLFSRLASYFSDIATATLDTKEMVQSLGISFKEFTKLQKAAETFRINDKQFSSLFQDLNKKLIGFRLKLNGELIEIARLFRFEIEPGDTEKSIFFKILQDLATIESESQRILKAQAAFGPELGTKLANLSVHLQKFKDTADSFEGFAQELNNNLPNLTAYEQSVINLTQAWQDFVIYISKDVFPVFEKLFGYLKGGFEIAKVSAGFWTTLFKGDKEGFIDNLKQGSKLLDPVFEGVKTGASNAYNVLGGIFTDSIMPFWKAVVDYAENKEGYQYRPNAGISSPMVTNNIEVNVGSGTGEQQANLIAETIEQKIDEGIFRTFMNIQNNNPVVE